MGHPAHETLSNILVLHLLVVPVYLYTFSIHTCIPGTLVLCIQLPVYIIS